MSEPFNHIATLNLFQEPDGTYEITVMSGQILDPSDELKPIDHIENMVIAAATRMMNRKSRDGTFRILEPHA